MTSFAAAALLLVGASSLAQAQDPKERLKRQVLQKIEALIRQEEARILKDIEALLDRELKTPGAPEAKPTVPAQPPAPKEARGWLGIRIAELPDTEREELKLKPGDGGVKVAEVFPETAADGKLEVDDVILKVDGAPIAGPQALADAVSKAKAGTVVKLSILREGKAREIEIKLGPRPEDVPKAPPEPEKKEDKLGKAAPEEGVGEKLKELLESLSPGNLGDLWERIRASVESLNLEAVLRDLWDKVKDKVSPEAKEEPQPAGAFLGISVEELSPEEREKAGLAKDAGVAVSSVRPGTPASAAGIREGDILVRLGGKPVGSAQALRDLLDKAKPGAKIEIELLREGKSVKLPVTPSERNKN